MLEELSSISDYEIEHCDDSIFALTGSDNATKMYLITRMYNQQDLHWMFYRHMSAPNDTWSYCPEARCSLCENKNIDVFIAYGCIKLCYDCVNMSEHGTRINLTENIPILRDVCNKEFIESEEITKALCNKKSLYLSKYYSVGGLAAYLSYYIREYSKGYGNRPIDQVEVPSNLRKSYIIRAGSKKAALFVRGVLAELGRDVVGEIWRNFIVVLGNRLDS